MKSTLQICVHSRKYEEFPRETVLNFRDCIDATENLGRSLIYTSDAVSRSWFLHLSGCVIRSVMTQQTYKIPLIIPST